MADMMTFPNTVEEFMEQYKIVDTEKIYTNGADLVPIFRMMQWFEHVSATDTISRQAAIDAFNARLGELVVGGEENAKSVERYLNKVIEKIKALPSAQPEQNLDEWCDSCKEYDKEKYSCPRWNKVIKNTVDELKSAQPEQCEDAVSRTAVIDTIDEWKEACVDSGHKETASDIMLIRKDFIELPHVTPKQRTGKWIPVDSYTAYGGDEATWMAHGNPVAFYYCSECKEHAYAGEDGDDILSKFCPNCGVKMKGVAE